jgi:GTP pyrophosphokinase
MHSVQEITERFRLALDYAAQKHAQQTRKASAVPYLSHLLGVCSIFMANSADEDVWIAALLHDSIEDQGGETTAVEIERLFGKRVADLVRGCSELTAQADAPKPTWLERKIDYLSRLPDEEPAVMLISAADKLHNARSVLADWRRFGDDVYGRFTMGKTGTHWYYHEMARAYRESGKVPAALVQELEETVAKFAPTAIELSEVSEVQR